MLMNIIITIDIVVTISGLSFMIYNMISITIVIVITIIIIIIISSSSRNSSIII